MDEYAVPIMPSRDLTASGCHVHVPVPPRGPFVARKGGVDPGQGRWKRGW